MTSEAVAVVGQEPLEVGPWYYVWDDVVIGDGGDVYRPVSVETLLAWIRDGR